MEWEEQKTDGVWAVWGKGNTYLTNRWEPVGWEGPVEQVGIRDFHRRLMCSLSAYVCIYNVHAYIWVMWCSTGLAVGSAGLHTGQKCKYWSEYSLHVHEGRAKLSRINSMYVSLLALKKWLECVSRDIKKLMYYQSDNWWQFLHSSQIHFFSTLAWHPNHLHSSSCVWSIHGLLQHPSVWGMSGAEGQGQPAEASKKSKRPRARYAARMLQGLGMDGGRI
jgi:hypothetical protein